MIIDVVTEEFQAHDSGDLKWDDVEAKTKSVVGVDCFFDVNFLL